MEKMCRSCTQQFTSAFGDKTNPIDFHMPEDSSAIPKLHCITYLDT